MSQARPGLLFFMQGANFSNFLNIMKFILGKKLNMTQVFDEKGRVYIGTLISAAPMKVTQIKNADKDGYQSVQVGSGEKRAKTVSKAVLGHIKDLAGENKAFEYIKEFRTETADAKVGDTIDVSIFKEGDDIVVSGISKGKGFQGVVKRHGFHGGFRSHGNKSAEREPGSIGSTGPQRVFKGVRMAGRMGGERTSVKGLKIVKIDTENNQILVSGAIPGRRGTLIEVIAK